MPYPPPISTSSAHSLAVSRARLPFLSFTLILLLTPLAPAADLSDARKLFDAGRYADCRRMAQAAVAQGAWQEDWRLMQIEAELATGEYDAALKTYQDAITRYSSSIALRWVGRRVLLMNDR